MSGHVVEIGPFEGRFFIAMALGLADRRERARDRSVRLAGSGRARAVPAQLPDKRRRGSSQHLADRQRCGWAGRLAGEAERPGALLHIDGTHSCESLARDLEVAHAVLHERGIIAIDDMLHPGYPT